MPVIVFLFASMARSYVCPAKSFSDTDSSPPSQYPNANPVPRRISFAP